MNSLQFPSTEFKIFRNNYPIFNLIFKSMENSYEWTPVVINNPELIARIKNRCSEILKAWDDVNPYNKVKADFEKLLISYFQQDYKNVSALKKYWHKLWKKNKCKEYVDFNINYRSPEFDIVAYGCNYMKSIFEKTTNHSHNFALVMPRWYLHLLGFNNL